MADNYELEKRRAQVAEDPGYSEDHWATFAELGWLALPFAEEDGGIGGDALDVMVVMEQFGKGLVLEPFFATVVLGGGVLKRTLAGDRRAELLGGIIAGTHKYALAHTEEQGRWDVNDVTTAARADGDDYVLNGAKSMVLGAHTANGIIVSARTSGGQMDKNGISLFLVDPSAEGVKVETFPCIDGHRASEVTLTDVRVPAADVLGEVDGATNSCVPSPTRPRWRCAQKPSAASSAVQGHGGLHAGARAVRPSAVRLPGPPAPHGRDVRRIRAEQVDGARASMEFVQNGNGAERTISGCKHLIGEAGKFISEQAVQLHGGMGVTEELALGHYFMRQFAIETQFGNADFHLERYAA